MEEEQGFGRMPDETPGRELQTVEEALRQELAQAQREATENRELYLRALAERENARKRLERLYEDRLAEVKRDLLRRVIAVADNLERALAHPQAGEALVEGVRLTYRQLLDMLRSEGVEQIQTIGKPFDPAEAEAVAVVRGPEPPGTVVGEELHGYRQGDYLIRPARVHVISGEPD